MNFFNRTTRWVLAPLADRLELPDQDCTPLSSNNPLLRRILAGVEQLLQERRTLKDQAHALSMDVARLTEQLAERDSHWHQAHAHWALISQGAGEWFWTLELDAGTTPTPE
ncbi:chemotaxis protein, partial [Pseudomonas sp. MWU12-2323]|nr:chemotaxis protein [Pseudomonas sp. MWU12-2323]